MTSGTWLTAAGELLGLISLVVAVWAVVDARHQRSKREKAVIAARSVIERTYGFLIGIKPFLMPLGEDHKAAINNALQAIDQQRPGIAEL
jgi:hypothetical protein